MFCLDYVGRMLTSSDAEILEYAFTLVNIDQDILTSCSDIIKYNGRNYFFEFSEDNWDEMLDAGPVGNATRFLNHTAEELANCEARSESQHGAIHTRQLNYMRSSSSCQWGASYRILHQ
jgi:hypothetical protein